MRIVADENIPLLQEFFGNLAEIVAVPGRTMTAAQVRDADVLLVRSVTQVNAQLLSGSRVRFVGTATIGCDHVDLAYLDQQQIKFANAPGCNAASVVEYVLSSLTVLAERFDFNWLTKRVGIVGLGNVGSCLQARLTALGVSVLANDPPRAAQGESGLVSLDEVLACDVISLHTPLTDSGEYPTRHLLDERTLGLIKSDQILINTGRGQVIKEQALLQKLIKNPQWPVVLDVWETEPQVSPELLQRVQLGTPHIAGYSLDGKMRGTEMIYQALCRYLETTPKVQLNALLPPPPLSALQFSASASPMDVLTTAMRACYDPRTDDALLRQCVRSREWHEQPAGFDALRKNYRVRREFGQLQLILPSSASASASAAVQLAQATGFDVLIR